MHSPRKSTVPQVPTTSSVPTHSPRVVYFIFFVLGCGTMFPWNAFITATEYIQAREFTGSFPVSLFGEVLVLLSFFCGLTPFFFNFSSSLQSFPLPPSLFCNPPSVPGFSGTPRSNDYLSFFGVTFNASSFLALAYCVHRNQSTIIAPLITYTLLFAGTAALVLVDSVDHLFAITLLSLGIAGGTTAMLTAGVFGLAALFPTVNTQALMAGQGLAGMVTSVASILTLLAVEQEEDGCGEPADDGSDDAVSYETDWAAFIYFTVSVFALLSCVGCYLALDRMPVTEYYRERGRRSDRAGSGEGEGSGEGSGGDGESCADEESSEAGSAPLLDNAAIGPSEGVGVGGVGVSAGTVVDSSIVAVSIGDVYAKVKAPAVSVFVTFLVTLSLFPTITGSINSVNGCDSGKGDGGRFHNDLFVPFSFLLFNGGDFAGRTLAAYVSTSEALATNKILLVTSLSRLVFFPLFLLCNVDSTHLPVVFNSDFYPITFMLLFAATNGLNSTVCMMSGPSLVAPSEREMAGNIMVFALGGGLFAGSLGSFFCLKVGTGEW